jgi:hypothetical protein
MNSNFRIRPLFLALLVSLTVGSISYATLTRFSHPSIVPCTDNWSDNLLLSLALVLLIQIFVAPKILPGYSRIFVAAHALLLIVIVWLGLYPISPLGYATGRIPNLHGFRIIRMSRTSIIQNREVISLPQGSAVGISPLLLAPGSDCKWMSSAGGELDDTSSCDTVYSPPAADFDILRVNIQSSCGLPDSTAQIKVAILP